MIDKKGLTNFMNMSTIYIQDPFRFTYHFNNQSALIEIKNTTYQRSSHFPKLDFFIFVQIILFLFVLFYKKEVIHGENRMIYS